MVGGSEEKKNWFFAKMGKEMHMSMYKYGIVL